MAAQQEDEPIITPTVGGVFAIKLDDETWFTVNGCPVADGKGPCSTTCGGGVAGSGSSTEELTKAVAKGIAINLNKIGCQPVVDSIRAGLQEFQQRALVFEAQPAAEKVEDEIPA